MLAEVMHYNTSEDIANNATYEDVKTMALDPVFPISALQRRQAEVREAAKKGIVRLTENGVGAYVFCSEEQFNRMMENVAAQAAYETELAQGVERGLADIEAGRVVPFDELLDELGIEKSDLDG